MSWTQTSREAYIKVENITKWAISTKKEILSFQKILIQKCLKLLWTNIHLKFYFILIFYSQGLKVIFFWYPHDFFLYLMYLQVILFKIRQTNIPV